MASANDDDSSGSDVEIVLEPETPKSAKRSLGARLLDEKVDFEINEGRVTFQNVPFDVLEALDAKRRKKLQKLKNNTDTSNAKQAMVPGTPGNDEAEEEADDTATTGVELAKTTPKVLKK